MDQNTARAYEKVDEFDDGHLYRKLKLRGVWVVPLVGPVRYKLTFTFYARTYEVQLRYDLEKHVHYQISI